MEEQSSVIAQFDFSAIDEMDPSLGKLPHIYSLIQKMAIS